MGRRGCWLTLASALCFNCGENNSSSTGEDATGTSIGATPSVGVSGSGTGGDDGRMSGAGGGSAAAVGVGGGPGVSSGAMAATGRVDSATAGGVTATTDGADDSTAGGPMAGTGGVDSSAAGGEGGASAATGASTTGSVGDASGVVVLPDCGYEPCGGGEFGLQGTNWQYTRACIEEATLLDPFEDLCPTAEVVDGGGEVSGTLVFGGVSCQRNMEISVSAVVRLPAECAEACDLATMDLSVFRLPGYCFTTDMGCECLVSAQDMRSELVSCSASSDTLTIDEGNLTYDETTYCLGEDTLSWESRVERIDLVYEMARD